MRKLAQKAIVLAILGLIALCGSGLLANATAIVPARATFVASSAEHKLSAKPNCRCRSELLYTMDCPGPPMKKTNPNTATVASEALVGNEPVLFSATKILCGNHNPSCFANNLHSPGPPAAQLTLS